MKIYIENLGQRDTDTDTAQIIWFFEQRAKALPERQRVAYFLQIKNTLTAALTKCQAFELLAFIKSQVTVEQERLGQKRRAQAKLRAEAETQKLHARARKLREKNHFFKLFQYYNTPN